MADCPQHLSIQVELGLLILHTKTIILHPSYYQQTLIKFMLKSDLYAQVKKLSVVRVMVFNPTSTIFQFFVTVNFIGGGNRSTLRKPPTCRKSLTNFITQCCIQYTLPWAGFKLVTLVVIGSDCTGSSKSNCHTITTMTAPVVRSRPYNVGRNILVV